MRFFINLRRHDAMRKAKEWFTPRGHYATYEEIVAWAESKEDDWGECFVMLEVDVPGRGNINSKNVDLLLAFSDRLAVIEVKNHRSYRSAQTNLSKSLRQCCTSFDLVRAHMAGAVAEDSVRAFLYVPELESHEIASLTDQQLASTSMSHATVVGGERCRHRPTLPNGHPLYLPHALKVRLSDSPAPRSRAVQGAQETFLALLDKSEVYEFSSLRSAVNCIREHDKSTPVYRLSDRHVRGLRETAREQVIDRLSENQVVEIVGSAGAGKSDFIREALETLTAREQAESLLAVIEVTSEHTLSGLLRHVLCLLDAEPTIYDTDDVLREQLKNTPGTVWVRRHERRASPVLTALVDLLGAASCRLIIESTYGQVLQSESIRIELPQLEPRDLRTLVENISPQPSASAFIDVIAASSTSPIHALKALDLVPDGHEPIARGFGWLEDALHDPFSRDLCYYLVFILGESPIEMRVEALLAGAREVFKRHLPSAINSTTRQVLSPILANDAVSIDVVRGQDYPFLGEEHSAVSDGWFMDPDPALVDYVRKHLPDSLKQQWRMQTANVLSRRFMAKRSVRVLTALWDGDLRPWCDSAFRGGYLGIPGLVSWLDRRTDPVDVTEENAQLERALRLAASVIERKADRASINVDAELGRRSNDWYWPAYFRDLLSNVVTYGNDRAAEFTAVEPTDVSVETTCWTYLMSRRSPSEDWPAIEGCTRVRTSPPIRMLTLHHALMCACMRGEQFIRDANLRSQLIEWSIELGRTTMTEGTLFFLNAAETFHEFLGAKEGQNDALGRRVAYLRWVGRNPDGVTLDEQFWNEVGRKKREK